MGLRDTTAGFGAGPLVAILCVMLCAGTTANSDPAQSPRYRPDRIILKPRANATPAAVHAAHAAAGAHIHRQYPMMGGLQVVRVPRGRSVKQLIEQYQRTGLFEYVEPDYELSIAVTPDDPSYSDGTLWGLNNTGQNSGTPDADIDAPEGWDVRTNAANIIVEDIDTGIRYTHEDLAANMWHNPGEIPGNGIDDDGNGYIDDVYGINSITGSGDPWDDHFHGTHTAGTIGAVGNNGTGVCGVAWRVQLMACKFLDSTGSGSTSDAIECINYGIAKGVRIMSNSWGGGGFDPALHDAIAAARAAGIIFVAAAGNNSSDTDASPFYPANYDVDNVVSVAATDRNDALASFSNYGANTADLGAPGVQIYSTYNTGDNSYNFLSGTSMATPHVSGVLALLAAQFPSDTYTQLINRVLGNTDQIPSLIGKCVTEGRLNLNKALTLPPGPIARFTMSPTGGEPPLIVNFTDTSVGAITNRVWDFGDGSPSSNVPNPTHTYYDLGTFNVTLTVFSSQGSASKTRSVTVAHNYQMQPTSFSWIDPSVMTPLTLTDDSVSAAQSLPFTFTFYGQTYTSIYVGSNGLLGFNSAGLFQFSNADMPNPSTPNGIICAYWDDLNPGTNGVVLIGTVGSTPNRIEVISWVGLPHWPQFTPTYTFQVLLYEGSSDIVFQYLDVQSGDASYGSGLSATIGVENQAGTVARKYSFNGSTTVTNNQAILFTMQNQTLSFVMDGSVDSTNYLQASAGMTLYAAVRGQTLYVATWSPGTNGPNDHFVFVTDQLLPSASAPWAKAGTVATASTKPFLAGESQNDFVGWFVNSSATNFPAIKSPTSLGQMEGTLDLVQAFGSMPTTLYLAAAAYSTTDASVLVSQAPAGNGNGNIESNEFLAVPVVALLDNNADGVYDRLDPALDFVVTSAQPAGDSGFTVNWASVPGKTYQIQFAGSPGGPWQDLPGGQRTAGPGQIILSVTDNTVGGAIQRFYRVNLLP